MSDYKHTLNLPNTEFAMKANLAQREPGILKQWQEMDLYQALRRQHQAKEKFILHDGPPYANGKIHLGHAVNKILKDIVVKSKSFSGYDAPYIPGWDCHGLPIELNVEKKYGKSGEKLSAKAFREKCREYAAEQINLQRDAFIRLGCVADWHNPYLTMNYQYEANIIKSLFAIINNGHLQQGFKPVHWCMDCRSALAEAEVEYTNKTSPAIDVRFRVLNSNDFLQRLQLNEDLGHGTISIPIWTTTPWTLPANEAVALSDDVEYALVQVGGERLLLAAALVENVMQRYQCQDYKILVLLSSSILRHVEHYLIQHPFYQKQVPIIFGKHVTVDAGTGAVHTAPAHGQEDYIIGQQYKLPMHNPVDEKGCFHADVEFFANEFVFKANAQVIEKLKEKNTLLHEAKVEHSYPHCWRHHTPVIFRATPQWFVSMDNHHLREMTLAQIKTVKWLPDWGQARIESMIATRPDWCISRQRNWCVPMALIVDKQTKQLHPDMETLSAKIVEKVALSGIEAWHDLELAEFLGADADNYEKVNDTLDVWFDSGVSHYAVVKQTSALQFPADLYLEGSDQHRGWFQSSLLTAVAMYQQAPYKTVLTHGFTIDEKGHKMSKSLGNTIEPEKIINSLGADILRLWVAATDYSAEMALSNEILQRMSEAYRRIRNTARFLLANLPDFIVDQHLLPVSDLLSLDHWIIQQAQNLQTEIIQAYNNYEFHAIYQKIQNFCIVELGGFYLDIIKDRQYTMQKDSRGRRSAQTAIYHILQAMVRWIAPILSFTAEEIWQYLPAQHDKATSVFLNEWYIFPELADHAIDWTKILALRVEVNKAIELQRNAGIIGSALEANVEIIAPKDIYDLLIPLDNELRFVWITSAASVKQGDFLHITVSAVNAEKCARCWHRRDDVGQHPAHADICERCIDNLPEGKGEQRSYA